MICARACSPCARATCPCASPLVVGMRLPLAKRLDPLTHALPIKPLPIRLLQVKPLAIKPLPLTALLLPRRLARLDPPKHRLGAEAIPDRWHRGRHGPGA